jgi:hypothetical protein
LIQTHEVAINVLRAGGFDVKPYEIWRDEFGGKEKLDVLTRLEQLLPEQVHKYAQVLTEQVNELLAQGCSEELVLATYDYLDRLHEMAMEELQATPSVSRPETVQSDCVSNSLAMAA